MKKNQKPGIIAFTLADLLVCLAVVAVIVLLAIPALAGTSVKSVRVSCMNNLRQIAVAFRVWEGGNSGNFPQFYAGSPQYPSINSSIPGSNQGTTWSGTGCPNQYTVFLQMSNELNNFHLTICPADTVDRIPATNAAQLKILKNGAVSYFVGKATADPFPRMFLVGDRNISQDTSNTGSPYGYSPAANGGSGVGSITTIFTNRLVAPLNGQNFGWTPRIHQTSGNVVLADGSVQNYSFSALKSGLANSGDTNTAGNTLLFP